MAYDPRYYGDGTDSGGYVEPDLPPSDVTGLTVAKGVVADTAVLTFSIRLITGVSLIQIYRSFTKEFAAASAINTVARSIGAKSYTDSDAAIAGKDVWYWVVLTNSTYGSQDNYGPVNLSLAPAAPPVAPDFFDVSHDALQNGLLLVHGVVAVTDPAAFRSVRVYVNGYNGVMKDILVHQDTDTRFVFALEQTDEDITVKAVAANSDGVFDITKFSSKALHLGAAATKPCKVVVAKATCFLNGVQVDVEAGREANITSYKLWRSLRAQAFANAVVIQTVPATGESIVTMFDPNGDSATYNYYVTVVNDAGESDPCDPFYDGTAY